MELKDIKTVCFTGHRHIEYGHALNIPGILKETLEKYICSGAEHFRTGGAMGFDTVAALCILELQEKYPCIKLDLILPCRDQSEQWSAGSKRVYDYILGKASSAVYISDTYTQGCMHERNRRLVDGSQLCIAYCLRSSGGTAYTYAYAIKQGLEVINIYDKLKK